MKILITILLSSSLIACKKQSGILSLTPSCILNKIEDLKKQPKRNPAAVVEQYTYLNEKVYYITSDCCDQYNILYDSDCNIICAPGGGISGRGDGKCADFFESARNKLLIWEDSR